MKAWTAADIRKLEKERDQALVVIDVLTNERDWLRHWLKEQAASEQALSDELNVARDLLRSVPPHFAAPWYEDICDYLEALGDD